MPREMVKSLTGCWCWALDLHVLVGDGVDADVILSEMIARKHVILNIFQRWGRPLVGLDEGFDLLHLSLHLGVEVVVLGIELVVVGVDRRWNAFPIHHKTRAKVSRRWDKQYQVTFSQRWGCIPFHSMWNERIVELVPDLFTHTYQVKLTVELGEDSGPKIWCKMLARVNNFQRDSQICKWNK